MKNYDRYPGENCIVPTPSDGSTARSGLEIELSGTPTMPTAEKFTPLYNATFYGTRTTKLVSQDPVMLRSESAQERSA